jgi:hypothetical protein
MDRILCGLGHAGAFCLKAALSRSLHALFVMSGLVTSIGCGSRRLLTTEEAPTFCPPEAPNPGCCPNGEQAGRGCITIGRGPGSGLDMSPQRFGGESPFTPEGHREGDGEEEGY